MKMFTINANSTFLEYPDIQILKKSRKMKEKLNRN